MCSALYPPSTALRMSAITAWLSSNSAISAASVRVSACLAAAALATSLALAITAASTTLRGVPSRLAMAPAGTPRMVSCSTAASRSVSVRASRRSFACHCLAIRSASVLSSTTISTGTVGRPTLTAPRVRRWPRLTLSVPSSARVTWIGSITPNSRSEARNCRSRCAAARTLSPMMRLVGSTSTHSRATVSELVGDGWGDRLALPEPVASTVLSVSAGTASSAVGAVVVMVSVMVHSLCPAGLGMSLCADSYASGNGPVWAERPCHLWIVDGRESPCLGTGFAGCHGRAGGCRGPRRHRHSPLRRTGTLS